MTKAMPFLQKAILLSYDPRRFRRGDFALSKILRPRAERSPHHGTDAQYF